jgi:hypothetical protein
MLKINVTEVKQDETGIVDIQVGPASIIIQGECHFCSDWPVLVFDYSQYDKIPESVKHIGYTICLPCLMLNLSRANDV